MKKLFSFAITAVLILSSFTMAYAGESAESGDPSAQAVVKEIPAEKIQQAQELGIDITGMTRAEAKAAIQAAVWTKMQLHAEKLGIDISGLTKEEAKVKIQEAVLAKIQLHADKFGIDITGLTKDEARALIKEAREACKAGNMEDLESSLEIIQE